MVRILDEDFKILLTIPYHTSVVWTKRFTEGGSFSLSLPIDFETDLDLTDKIIYHNDNYGIIRYINITSTSIEIKGYDLKGIFALRQAEKKSYSGSVETIIKSIVSDNTNGNRGFPNFSVSADQGRGENITYDIVKNDSVENILKEICTQYNIGYDITVFGTRGKMRFDIKIPETINITYSERKKNISDYQYTYDMLDGVTAVKNYGHADGVKMDTYRENSTWYVKITGKICFPNGQIEEIDKTPFFDITSTSPRYVYAYLNNNDIGVVITPSKETDEKYVLIGFLTLKYSNNTASVDTETYKTNNEYLSYIGETEPTGYKRNEYSMEMSDVTEAIKTEINKKLYEDTPTESITATLLSKDDYKKEWDLGDYINIKIYVMGQSLTLSKQIVEVEEVYEPNNIQVNPTFGQSKDNIIRKLIKGRL